MLFGKYTPQLVGDTFCPADHQVLVIVRMTIYPVLYVAVLDIVRQLYGDAQGPLYLLQIDILRIPPQHKQRDGQIYTFRWKSSKPVVS